MVDEKAREDFCRRFVARMVERAGETFDDGGSIREYAEQTAATYYEQEWQREYGPEECADTDISYWED